MNKIVELIEKLGSLLAPLWTGVVFLGSALVIIILLIVLICVCVHKKRPIIVAVPKKDKKGLPRDARGRFVKRT